MVTGKTTARAWRQPVTGFSPVPAVVGDFMPPWGVAMAGTIQAAVMVQAPSPGCAGRGQGCRESAEAQEQMPREFRWSLRALQTFYSHFLSQEPKSFLPMTEPHC